jgi:hypothetical protein
MADESRKDKEKPLGGSVEDEQDQTSYRMVVDYLSSIWISWLNNIRYFSLLRRRQMTSRPRTKHKKAVIAILILILLGLFLLSRTRQALFRPQRVFDHR